MTIRFAVAGLLLAIIGSLVVAQIDADKPAAPNPAPDAGDQAAAAPPAATQPDLPGGDCDLRAAVALADSIVVAKAADIDSANKTMQTREGKLGLAHLTVGQTLKGKGDAPLTAFLPIATDDDADIPRVAPGQSVIMFIGHDGDSPVLFKAMAPSDQNLANVADLIKTPPPAQAAAPLRCDIVVHDPPISNGGILIAALELTNTGDEPIRICVAGSPVNDLTADVNNNIVGSDVRFEADKFKAAPPPDYELSRQIVTIPAKRAFLLAVGYAAPANGAITLTAHFSVPQALADKLNLWQGDVDAPSHTIFLQPPATQPAQP